jgi:ectoine hydroxylase-related dioxygenase (phytanoyl-CoA dioxygenase family)
MSLPTPLSDDQVREFFEQGFTVVRGVFTPAEIAEIAAGFSRLEVLAQPLDGIVNAHGANFAVDRQPQPDGSTRVAIRRVSWCGGADPVLLRYGGDPRLLAMAAQLLGSRTMNQLINQAHFKAPGDNIQFPWHQDSTHRGYGGPGWEDVNGRGSYVQLATAIDASTLENGPLLFIPGSCKHGHLGLKYTDHDWATSDKFDPATAVPVLAEPGDVALFGPYTIHGSTPNRSKHSRRVFINGFAYPGANRKVYPGNGAGRLLALPATL